MNTSIKASPRPWTGTIEECNQEHERVPKKNVTKATKNIYKKTWPKTQRPSTKEHDQGDQDINK